MAVPKESILFFKYDDSDLVLFILLSSDVQSCNSCLNSTKFSLRTVMLSLWHGDPIRIEDAVYHSKSL